LIDRLIDDDVACCFYLSGAKKDPGIPNLHPLKEKILADYEHRKEKAERELHRQKEVLFLSFPFLRLR
jgi:hypothetical protein